MSVEHGPSACAPCCIACGEAISDDGAEQTDAWLESMCGPCHEARESGLRDWDAQNEIDEVAEAEYERRNADHSCDYEPRSAF